MLCQAHTHCSSWTYYGTFERPPHHYSALSKCTCVFFKVTLPKDSSIVRGDFVEVAESQRIFPSLSASVIHFLYLFGWSGPKLSVWEWFNDSLLFLFLCHVFAPSLTFCFSLDLLSPTCVLFCHLAVWPALFQGSPSLCFALGQQWSPIRFCFFWW